MNQKLFESFQVDLKTGNRETPVYWKKRRELIPPQSF
jgi:hypothetical protein